jgi:hypothetical protein
MTSDGLTLVAADPDRDMVWWTKPGDATPTVQSYALNAGDEPGRVVEDAAGLVHVALRRGGAVVTLDLSTGTLVRRTSVCPAPRGLAYDATQNAVVVACVGGELVTLSAVDDSVVRSLVLDTDLRDPVLLAGGFIAVSKLRNAEVLLVNPSGAIVSRTRPIVDGSSDPTSAWRMVGAGSTVSLTHELATTEAVDTTQPNGYSNGGGNGGFGGGGVGGGGATPPPPPLVTSSSIVVPVLTTMAFDLSTPTAAPGMSTRGLNGGLPVDLATDATQQNFAVVQYASSMLSVAGLTNNITVQSGSSTSVAFAANGGVALFARDPAAFFLVDSGGTTTVTVPVPGAISVTDTGHDLFHRAAQSKGGVLACASCHPEGRDDGRVWTFIPQGQRRTPSLVGGLLPTAPFHWDGTLNDMTSLMGEVFTKRMGGDVEDAAHSNAVGRFLGAVQRVPVSAVPAASQASWAHGQELFQSAEVGCTSCHSGAHFTNNATIDVGTGDAFQVPTLIGVGLRAPYLHDGCAASLADRFGPCGGGDRHGTTSQLSSSDIGDLITYLQTL